MDRRAQLNQAKRLMLIRFEALGATQKRNEFVKIQDDARRFWSLFLESGWQAADFYLAERFPQLDVFKGSDFGSAVLRSWREGGRSFGGTSRCRRPRLMRRPGWSSRCITFPRAASCL